RRRACQWSKVRREGLRSHEFDEVSPALRLHVLGILVSASGGEKTYERIRSSTCSHTDGRGTSTASSTRVSGVRDAFRRASHPFLRGPLAAPFERVPGRFLLRLLPAADQPGRKRGTRQAAGESDRQ